MNDQSTEHENNIKKDEKKAKKTIKGKKKLKERKKGNLRSPPT